jgi:WD40 repeat protein
MGTVRFRNPGGVLRLGFTADGKTLLSEGGDKTVRGFDLATGAEVFRLPHDEEYAAFGPGGRSVALMDREGRTRVVDPATGKELARLQAPRPPDQGWVKAPFLLTPDGTTLVTGSIPKGFTGSGDGVLHVIDLTTGKERAQVRTPPVESGAVLSPDGDRVAATGHTKGERSELRVFVWDTCGGKPVRQFATRCYSTDLAFSPDGRTLASGDSESGDVYLWDVDTGKECGRLSHKLCPHEGIAWLTFSPRGGLLATVADGGQVFVWDLTGRAILSSFQGEPPRSGTRVVGPVFTPDGKALAVPLGSAVQLVDTASGRPLPARGAGHRHGVYELAVSPDGKKLFTRGRDTVRVWDMATGKERRVLAEPAWRMGLSRDGKHLVTLGNITRPEYVTRENRFCDVECGPLKVWDLAGGGRPREIDLGPKCRQVVFSPDVSKVAVADWSEKVQLWDVAACKKLDLWEVDRAGELVFSPDGTFLADYCVYLSLSLLKPGGGPRRFAAECHGHHFVISPDGKALGTWGLDGALHLYEVATGKEQARLELGKEGVRHLSLLPDGKTLVAECAAEVIAWDVTAPRQLWEIKGATGPLVYLPAFDVLAASADDGKAVGLWDAATGKELGRLTGYGGRVRRLAAHDGGRVLVSASTDCTALVWDVARALGR